MISAHHINMISGIVAPQLTSSPLAKSFRQLKGMEKGVWAAIPEHVING
jgi:hypothetical protein